MALTKDQKKAQIAELKDKMSRAQSIMFAHYIGLTVDAVSDFRNKLREGEAEMKVAKKTLMRLAAKDANVPEIPDEILDGPVACIFSFNEPLSGAQIAFKFGKENDQVKLIGGFFEGKMLSAAEAMELAQIPSHQALLGIFAGMCISPLSSFARALSLIAEQKEAPAEEKKEEAPATEEPKAEATPEEKPAEEPKTEEAPAEEKPTEETKKEDSKDSDDAKDSEDTSSESSESSPSSESSSESPEEKPAA